MAAISSSPVNLGNVVKAESLPEWGYCRKNASVLVASGMKIGAVVQWVAANSRYEWVANAGVATLNADVGIIVQDNIESLTAGAQTVTILNCPVVGGQAVVASQALQYADAVTAPNKVLVEAKLATRGILAVAQV